MMKKITLISAAIFSLFLMTNISSANYNNNYGYNVGACNSGVYNGYIHGYLADGQATYTSKNIENGNIYVTLTCRNAELYKTVQNISCDNGYHRSGDHCEQVSNDYNNSSYYNEYNNSYYSNNNYNSKYYNSNSYNNSCSSGTYAGYSHSYLANGRTTSVSKNISNGKTYATLQCNNGYISVTVTSINCYTGYYRNGDQCRYSSNNSYNNNYYSNNYNNNSSYNNNNSSYNNDSCSAGTYKGYSYGYLSDGRTTSASKYITNGKAFATIKCSDGNISRTVNTISCDSGYYKSGNFCKQSVTSYNNSSCSAGTYNGYSHSYLSSGRSISSSKYITNGKAYAKIHCTNGNVSRTITSLSCDSGYERSGDRCISTNNNYYYNQG